jgi:PQQ-like domain
MPTETDLLYVATGKYVIALDRFSGRVVWRVKLPRFFATAVCMLLPQDSELYVARSGYVYCLDRFSGAVLWERGVANSGLVLMATMSSDQGAQQTAATMAAQADQAAASAAAASAAV